MRLQDLAKPGVKLVLTNKEVPVSNYSRQALTKMSQDAAFGSEFATRVLANLVSEKRTSSKSWQRYSWGGGRRHCLFK